MSDELRNRAAALDDGNALPSTIELIADLLARIEKLERNEANNFEGMLEADAHSDALEAENKALREGLAKAGRTVGVLLQAVEGCAMNHYGEDFYLHGLPQYLVECRSEIETTRALLAKEVNDE